MNNTVLLMKVYVYIIIYQSRSVAVNIVYNVTHFGGPYRSQKLFDEQNKTNRIVFRGLTLYLQIWTF